MKFFQQDPSLAILEGSRYIGMVSVDSSFHPFQHTLRKTTA